MVVVIEEPPKKYNKVTPDGWIIDPDLWFRLTEKDTNKILALNVNCNTKDSWMINFLHPNLPMQLVKRCWKSISRSYANKRKALYERSLQTMKATLGSGIKSHTRSLVRIVRIFGKPLSEYSDLPKHGENDVWIGINWALKDPDGFDYCFCNSTTNFNGFDASKTQPILIASVLTNPQIVDSWNTMTLYYVPPALAEINPDSANIIGSLFDPGDIATAAVTWACKLSPKKLVFYDVDVTSSVSKPGAFQIDDDRWAFMGQGMNLAYWSSTLFLLKYNAVKFDIVSGWIPDHLKTAISA